MTDKRIRAGARFAYGGLREELGFIDQKLAVYAQNRDAIPESERPKEWAEETDRLLERRQWLVNAMAGYKALRS